MNPRRPDSQPIPPPSVRPADAGVDEGPADDREVMRPRRGVDVLPERATVDAHDPRRGVDRDRAPHLAQVDDQGAVGHRVPGHAVPAAADRDRQAEVARGHDRRDHIVVVADADDDRRPPLDRGVEASPARRRSRGRSGVVTRSSERWRAGGRRRTFHRCTPGAMAWRRRKQATWEGQVYTLGRAPIPAVVRLRTNHHMRDARSVTANAPQTDHRSRSPLDRADPPEHPRPRRPARPRRGPARPARRRDPRHDRPHGREHGRPPRLVARRGRADDRAPSAARVAARPDRLGHRPPGLPAQAPDRPARALRDAAPARWRRRLPAALRVAARRLRRRPRRDRACRSPRALPRRATCATASSGSRSSSATRR